MSTLTIHQGAMTRTLEFSAPQRLSAVLAKAGPDFAPLTHPCGGRGVCGKCAVMLTGAVSEPNAAERKNGVRLSCQAVLHGDAEVILPERRAMAQIEVGSDRHLAPVRPMPGRFGAAIDVGTTTLALRLYDLQTGACIAAATMLNPQTRVAADVIGRIDAALHGGGDALRASVGAALDAMLRTAAAQAQIPAEEVASLVVIGNTTMLYLLTGRDPFSLSRAPFAADCLFGTEENLMGRTCYLPDCLHAFVGADTSCAILSCGMLERDETTLLMDVGTNGELALRHAGRLYIASTAAGPAFEGAGISCGCGSVPGAIDRVDVEAGQLRVHTIDGAPPVGLCGSGLVDAVAALLESEIIDETGAMDGDAYDVASGVTLTQKDIRAVQLAKAAIAAGTACLLDAAGCRAEDISAVYLAGGFGSHLRLEKAAAIGMISPALAQKARAVGNAALDGAALLLTDTTLRARLKAVKAAAQHVRLDGNPLFSQRYVEEMLFGEG